MATNEEHVQSALTALSKVQGRMDEADDDDVRELDNVAWRIHDSIVGA